MRISPTRMLRPGVVVLGFGLWLFPLSGGWTEDWPRWRGPANDGHVSSGEIQVRALPSEPRVLWQVPAGEGLASPVIAGGRLFAFDNPGGRETLHALDARTGAALWSEEVDDPFSDTQGPTGPRNTPVVDEDRVYAVSCRGELQCRAVADGELIWHVNYVRDFHAVFIGERGTAAGASRHGNDGSPLVVGEHLLACVGGTNGAGVVCFEKRTGQVVWRSTSDQAGYAPPVFAVLHEQPQVICFTARGVVGLRHSDGELLWRAPVRTALSRHAVTPVVVGDRVLVSSHEAGLLCLRIRHEGETWTADTAWVRKDAAINFSSPVAAGDHLYGVGPNQNLMCVEVATGQTAWSQSEMFQTPPGKAYAGFLVFPSNILMLTDSGELVLFAASPDRYRELGRAQVCGLNWCNPAYADGVLYLRDGLRRNGHWTALQLAAAKQESR